MTDPVAETLPLNSVANDNDPSVQFASGGNNRKGNNSGGGGGGGGGYGSQERVKKCCFCCSPGHKSPTLLLVLCGVLLAIFFVTTVILSVALYVGYSPFAGPSVCSTSECVRAAGVILTSMNLSADPCNDFYQFACGGFGLHQSIPAGLNKLTQFNQIDNVIQKQLREVVEAPAPADESESRQKARRYYWSCMDTEAIKVNGVPSMKKMIEQMGGLYITADAEVANDWTINAMLEKRNAFTLSGFFHTSVGPDDMNVLTNIIQLDQGGLGLGSDTRDYYVDKDVATDPVLSAYADMLQSFAETALGGPPIDREKILDVVRFEQQLGLAQQSKAQQRDISVIYNKVNVSWLQEHAGFLNWEQFFSDLFNPVDIEINSSEPLLLYAAPYFKNLTKLFKSYETKKGKTILQNYVVFQAVVEYAPKFGESFKTAFDVFMSAFVGKRGSQEKWQICVSDTDTSVGYALGELFSEKYFTSDDRSRAIFVMSEIATAFRTRILEVSWMDDGTREKALKKIEALAYDVGYPDWLHNQTYMVDRYRNLTVTDDYTENQFAAFAYANRRLLRTLRQDPDDTRWLMTPQTVNAYYEPTQNKFVVPAGILNIPFFFAAEGVPTAINFGAIGSVTGHEITHGFDDQGSHYDDYGNLNNWWNNATMEKFMNQTKCLDDQYSAYEMLGLNLRGKQTLGENIADNGGVKTSYQAFRKAASEGRTGGAKKLVGVDLNEEQLFFIGYAQAWCSIFTPEAMKFQIQQNEHSPGPFRVIGPLSNSEEFSKVFNCPPESKMNPKHKCDVW